MTEPVDVVAAWFEAWDRGDVHSASGYIAPGAPTFVNGALVARGLDEFREWYAARRERLGDSFAYRVDELLAGEHTAAALIRLSTGRGSWRQVAVYHVAGAKIAELRVFEEPEPG